MRKTLLEIVQLIASSLDSDEVNSISDTVESTQIAKIVESCYYDMITDITMPEHQSMFQLNASGNILKPTLMTIPQTVTHIDEIRYDNKLDTETNPDYQIVNWLPFYDFMMRQSALRNEDTSLVGVEDVVMNGETFKIMYRKTVMPQYYTTIDETTLIFDSYNSEVDDTLQKTKTLCKGTVYPSFTMNNSFTPNIDPTQFSLLINRAKVRAFKELKQQANEEAVGEARRQKIIVQKRKRKVPGQAEVYRVARFGR